jgi:tetratricopeptide (TPR) repeat protein
MLLCRIAAVVGISLAFTLNRVRSTASINEYHDLLKFEKIIIDFIANTTTNNRTKDGAAEDDDDDVDYTKKHTLNDLMNSSVIRNMNIAMLYYQKYVSWNQDGLVQALLYIDLSLRSSVKLYHNTFHTIDDNHGINSQGTTSSCSSSQTHHKHGRDDDKQCYPTYDNKVNSFSHDDDTEDIVIVNEHLIENYSLIRGLLLHKSWILSLMGHRYSALSIINVLLLYHKNYSNIEVSTIIYHKADLLLSLYNDYHQAIELFYTSIYINPCNYKAFYQLASVFKTYHVTKNSIQYYESLIGIMKSYMYGISVADKHSTKTSSPRKHEYNRFYPNSIDLYKQLVYDNPFVDIHHRRFTDYFNYHTRVDVCDFHAADHDIFSADSGLMTLISITTVKASINWAIYSAYDSIVNALTQNNSQLHDTVNHKILDDYINRTGDTYYRDDGNDDLIGGSDEWESDIDNDKAGTRYTYSAPSIVEHLINQSWFYLQRARSLEMEEHVASQKPLVKQAIKQGSKNNHHPSGGEGDSSSRDDRSDSRRSSSKGSYSGRYDRLMNEYTTISGFIERQKQKGIITTHFTKDSWMGNNYTRFQGSDVGMGDADAGVEFTDYRSKIPVFIVGSARSGTTLLEKLLVSHSDPMGASKQLVWGMGEDTPFTFEMHAMHDEVMHVYKDMDTKKTMLLEQIKRVEKVGDKHRLMREIDKLEVDFMNAHQGIVNKRAEIIIRKLLNNYHQHHRDDDDVNQVSHASSKEKEKGINLSSRGHPRVKGHGKDDQRGKGLGGAIGGGGGGGGGGAIGGGGGGGGSVLSKMKTIRFIDKMVGNYFNIGLIHLVFPNAIIINMVRDPLDTLYSCYTTRFGVDSLKYTLYYKALVHHYTQYLEVVQHFRTVLPHYSLQILNGSSYNTDDCEDGDSSISTSSIVITTTTTTAVGDKRRKTKKRSLSIILTQGLIDVRYEELVAAPDIVMQRLRSIIGLREVHSKKKKKKYCQMSSIATEYNTKENDIVGNSSIDEDVWTPPSSLQKQVHVVLTASKLQVKQPIYSHSIGRWKRHTKQLMNNIIPELLHYLPYLASINALPFIDPCLSRYLQTIYKQNDFYREYSVLHDQYNFTYYRLENISLSQLQYQYSTLCSTSSYSIYNNSHVNWLLLDQHTYHFNY